MKNIEFSLICACYNEGPTFEENIGRILAVLKQLTKTWEIIFVEDKSTDKTREKLLALAKNIKNSKVILHSKNTGRGKAVSDGIGAARGIICGYMDVDCEISPKYLPAFIKSVEKGNDFVVAKRNYGREIKSINRIVVSWAYSLITKFVFSLPVEDTEAGFKFFNRRKILPVLQNTKDPGWFWDTEICVRSFLAGLKMTQIPVFFIRRTDKESTVKIFRDSLSYAIKLWRFWGEFKRLQKK